MVGGGTEARIATSDADSVIVRCALEKAASHKTLMIIGEDLNLAVLLIALASAENISFLKPGKGNMEGKQFSSRKLKEFSSSEIILFLHAFSWRGVTSTMYTNKKAKQ